MELTEELPDVEPPPEWVLERFAKLAEAAVFGDMGPESFTGGSGLGRS
jgi:hypothetical protein